MHLYLSGKNGGTNLHVVTRMEVYIVGSMTQISGCQDPFETESSRTRNIFSRRMNPSPIFHRLGLGSPTGYGLCCGSVLSNTRRADFVNANTYGHRV